MNFFQVIHEFFLLQINSNKEAFKDNFNKFETKEEKRENIFVKKPLSRILNNLFPAIRNTILFYNNGKKA